MDSDAQITVSQRQGREGLSVTVLHVAGEIGSHNSDQLQARASEEIEAGAHNLILDLSGITFMSSAGLRVMHAIYNKLGAGETGIADGVEGEGQKSQRLKISGPPANILGIIQAIGFDIYVEIYDDLQEAVDSF